MDLIDGECFVCKNNIVVKASQSKKILDVLKLVLANSINVDELNEVYSELTLCLSCLHDLHKLQSIQKKLKPTFTDRNTKTCVTCKETHMLINITEKWKHFVEILEDYSGKKIDRGVVCLECFVYLDQIHIMKEKLLSKYPKLKAEKKERKSEKKKSDVKNGTSQPEKKIEKSAKPKSPKVNLRERRAADVIVLSSDEESSPPGNKTVKNLQDSLKHLLPLKKAPITLDTSVKSDKRFFNQIPFVKIELSDLSNNNHLKRKRGHISNDIELTPLNQQKRLKSHISVKGEKLSPATRLKPFFKIKLNPRPKSKQKPASIKLKKPDDVKLVINLAKMDFSYLLNDKNEFNKLLFNDFQICTPTKGSKKMLPDSLVSEGNKGKETSSKKRKSVSFAEEKNIEIEYQDYDPKILGDGNNPSDIKLKPLLKNHPRFDDIRNSDKDSDESEDQSIKNTVSSIISGLGDDPEKEVISSEEPDKTTENDTEAENKKENAEVVQKFKRLRRSSLDIEKESIKTKKKKIHKKEETIDEKDKKETDRSKYSVADSGSDTETEIQISKIEEDGESTRSKKLKEKPLNSESEENSSELKEKQKSFDPQIEEDVDGKKQKDLTTENVEIKKSTSDEAVEIIEDKPSELIKSHKRIRRNSSDTEQKPKKLRKSMPLSKRKKLEEKLARNNMVKKSDSENEPTHSKKEAKSEVMKEKSLQKKNKSDSEEENVREKKLTKNPQKYGRIRRNKLDTSSEEEDKSAGNETQNKIPDEVSSEQTIEKIIISDEDTEPEDNVERKETCLEQGNSSDVKKPNIEDENVGKGKEKQRHLKSKERKSSDNDVSDLESGKVVDSSEKEKQNEDKESKEKDTKKKKARRMSTKEETEDENHSVSDTENNEDRIESVEGSGEDNNSDSSGKKKTKKPRGKKQKIPDKEGEESDSEKQKSLTKTKEDAGDKKTKTKLILKEFETVNKEVVEENEEKKRNSKKKNRSPRKTNQESTDDESKEHSKPEKVRRKKRDSSKRQYKLEKGSPDSNKLKLRLRRDGSSDNESDTSKHTSESDQESLVSEDSNLNSSDRVNPLKEGALTVADEEIDSLVKKYTGKEDKNVISSEEKAEEINISETDMQSKEIKDPGDNSSQKDSPVRDLENEHNSSKEDEDNVDSQTENREENEGNTVTNLETKSSELDSSIEEGKDADSQVSKKDNNCTDLDSSEEKANGDLTQEDEDNIESVLNIMLSDDEDLIHSESSQVVSVKE